MKPQDILAAIALALAGTACAADRHDHAHEHKPLHGGVVAEVKDVDYELVATPGSIRIHVRDHRKPANLSKASARITLLTGTDRQEVALKAMADRLEATGTFKVGPGTKAVAVITIDGRPATVRFALK